MNSDAVFLIQFLPTAALAIYVLRAYFHTAEQLFEFSTDYEGPGEFGIRDKIAFVGRRRVLQAMCASRPYLMGFFYVYCISLGVVNVAI